MAVTPLGRPETLNWTDPEYPPEGLMVIVQDPLPPGKTVRWSQADTVKPETVSVRFDPKPTGRTWPALVPAMVGKKTPVAPNAFAVTVMVEEVVAGLGLKLKATPLGTFTGPRPTDPEKPLIELIITWP